jgi:3'-phosphoadenosine 5'-phosphosulfate sulfotransferase (PAPS reductase)/FAD synthetase
VNTNILNMLNSSQNVVSISGGKDSTATLLRAIELGVKNISAVFADTGNEQQATYDYIAHLSEFTGIEIDVVKADFSMQVLRKKEIIKTKWVADGALSKLEADEMADLLEPTGNPFLDLCLWKGRFPSTMARFCSSELKHEPLDIYQLGKSKLGRVISWQGVRGEESPSRARLSTWDRGEYGSIIYRPILHWKWARVFEQHDKHGINPNPLYKQGMSRVGCMPCIHANKKELASIAMRYPEEIARIAEWERLVSLVAKRGNSTFFHASTDPMIATKVNSEISIKTHGINNIIDWAKTTRGGRQYDLIASTESVSMCSSAYGLCE